MTDLDLDAVRADYETYRAEQNDGDDDLEAYVAALWVAVADRVPALLAEVERLRALVAGANWCDCGIGASRDGLCDNSAIATMPHADDCPARDRVLAAEVDRLRAELAESGQLWERLAALLTGTADALKGDPGPLSLHDWSDLPRVARLRAAELATSEAELARVTAERNDAMDALAAITGATP